MNLDITGKVGIENAFYNLVEELDIAIKDAKNMKKWGADEEIINGQIKYIEGIRKAIGIVEDNLPVVNK